MEGRTMNLKNKKHLIAVFAMLGCLQTFASEKSETSETTEQTKSVETKHKAEEKEYAEFDAEHNDVSKDEFTELEKITTSANEDETFDPLFKTLFEFNADYYGFTQNEITALQKIATTAKKDEIFDHFFKALDDKDLKRIEFWIDHGAAEEEPLIRAFENKRSSWIQEHAEHFKRKLMFYTPKTCIPPSSYELSKTAKIFDASSNHCRILLKVLENKFLMHVLLLHKIITVDKENSKGESILCFLSRTGHNNVETYKNLIIFGANPNLKNNDGLSALSWANKNNNATLVDLFYEIDITRLESFLTFCNKNTRNKTQAFIRLNGLSELLTKLAKNISQSSKDEHLRDAIKYHDSIVVEFWLKQGADPNVKCEFYGTSLHEACERGSIEKIKLLLDCKKLNLNAQEDDGSTALHKAVNKACNRHTNENDRAKYIEIIKLLLKYGIDTELKKGNGFGGRRKPKDRAIDLADDTDVWLILASPQEKNERLMEYVTQEEWSKDSIKEFKKLIKGGVEINKTDRQGWTPLMHVCSKSADIALRSDNFSIIQDLLQCGSEITARDHKFINALHLAACHPNNVTLLNNLVFHKNAPHVINDVSKGGRTPLMIAAEQGDTQMCASLYQAGADPSIEYFGTSAFSLANEYAVKQKDYTLPSLVLKMIVHDKERLKPLKQLLNSYLPEENIQMLVANYEFEEESVEKKQEAENSNS